ncbi:MAG: threonine/serine dehydratase [Candidatus Thorarchaeota archaeon]|nr:threonine/serine dehydratase [Candidatus Thorarchaeota archaeon]
MEIPTLRDIQNAAKLLKTRIKHTPLVRSEFLSEVANGSVYLKLENLQKTGAFKIRGAFTALSRLEQKGDSKGVITASSGNHGQAVGLAAAELGINATIVVPEHVSKSKLKKIKQFDVNVIKRGSYEEVEPLAKQLAQDKELTYVSPYNHPDIIAGQGTVALEILEEEPDTDAIIVPVGGGGLISGIAIAAKGLKPEIQIIGVQAEASPMVYHCWKSNEFVKVQENETVASGLMGGIQEDSITLSIMRDNVDDMILVEEGTILHALKILYESEGQRVEGAAAVAVAAILKNPTRFRGKKVVAVLTGGNIEESMFQQLIRDTSS